METTILVLVEILDDARDEMLQNKIKKKGICIETFSKNYRNDKQQDISENR